MGYMPTLADTPEEEAVSSSYDAGYKPSIHDTPEEGVSSNESIASIFDNLSKLGIPLPAAKVFGMMLSANNPNVSTADRLAAAGRGFTEIGQGAKQFGLGAGEDVGLLPRGTQRNYTNQAEQERKLYESTPGAQDPMNQSLRENVADLPYMAATLPMGGQGSLLAKILQGAGIGGLAGATKYTNPKDSREVNAIMGSIGGATANAIPAVVNKALGIPDFMEALFTKKPIPESWVAKVQNGHDVLKTQAGNIYNEVKSQVYPEGVGTINIDQSVIDKAESQLPNTKANRKLIQDARSGDFNALHSLQSDLGQAGYKNSTGVTNADRSMGQEQLDTKDDILKAMKDTFYDNNKEYLGKMMDEARNKWRTLKDTYYSHPKIASMVEEDSRLVPKNPEDIFSENSVPMNKVLNAHPDIKNELRIYNNREKAVKDLLTAGKIGIGTTAGLYGAKRLIGSLEGE